MTCEERRRLRRPICLLLTPGAESQSSASVRVNAVLRSLCRRFALESEHAPQVCTPRKQVFIRTSAYANTPPSTKNGNCSQEQQSAGLGDGGQMHGAWCMCFRFSRSSFVQRTPQQSFPDSHCGTSPHHYPRRISISEAMNENIAPHSMYPHPTFLRYYLSAIAVSSALTVLVPPSFQSKRRS